MNILKHEIHCTVSDENKVSLTRFLEICSKNNIKVINIDIDTTKIMRVGKNSRGNFDSNIWFVSQNADIKTLNNKSLYLLTMRGYNTTIVDFQKAIKESLESFKHLLDDKEHFFIEKCIFDDNVQLDEHWMKPGV